MSFNFLIVAALASKQDLYMLPIIFTLDLNCTIRKSLCNQGEKYVKFEKNYGTGTVITDLFAAPITIISQPKPALTQTV
jgi:hypothetical protein